MYVRTHNITNKFYDSDMYNSNMQIEWYTADTTDERKLNVNYL
jgi:hypothetical protein